MCTCLAENGNRNTLSAPFTAQIITGNVRTLQVPTHSKQCAVPLYRLSWEHHLPELLQLVGKEQQLQRATLVPGTELRGASRSLPFDYLGKEALLSQPAGRETGLWF